MPSLKYRSSQEEVMDDLTLEHPDLYKTLRELDTINRLLGGNAITLSTCKKLIKQRGGGLKIADLGCGSGEMLRLLAAWCQRNGLDCQFTGFDANPYIIDYAKEHCKDYPEVSFRAENIFSLDFQQEGYDLVLSTLFFHHFSTPDLTRLFFQLNESPATTVVNDLHRHKLAYWSIKWLTAWFSSSAMVKNDAALSVWRGFKKGELKKLLAEAKVTNYELSWRWAFRWRLVF